MSFLPIVQRELRVSARRKSTWYVRAAAAMLGIVIGFFSLLMVTVTGSTRGGIYMFEALTWYVLLMTLLAGIFLASDCLSEERREGTLGLLFLTDLKGYDVVLGKFMAVSLNAIYGLLAFFPVLALCLLAGGVSVAEFWRTCLALLNLLFFSVTAGMFISSFCHASYRAMTGSLVLLVTWLVVTCIASGTGLYEVSEFSPFESFLIASDADYLHLAGVYWKSLGISCGIGWIFLGYASWRMRRFVDKGKTSGLWGRVFKRDLLSGRAVHRTRLLEINPVLWLLDDSRRLRWVAWVLSLAGVAVLIYMGRKGGPMLLLAGGWVMWPFYFLLKIFVAIQACRFFGEARRTGALELLCCTPLTMRAVIQGQWMLLRRVFLWPLVVLLSVHVVCLIFAALNGAGMLGGAPGMPGVFNYYFMYRGFVVIPNNLADFFALGWFGMWLALSMQRPNLAAGLTILCVLILPMIAMCVPTLATDAVFIVVGWVKLSEDFRLRQAQWVTLKPTV